MNHPALHRPTPPPAGAPEPTRYHRFEGRLLMVGFGSIGQGVLPLLLRHIAMRPEQIHIVAADAQGAGLARAQGVAFQQAQLDEANYRALLRPLLRHGDFVLNVSVNVSSLALATLCRELGALYLDTCIEPWEGGYADASLPLAERTNYALREVALALRDAAAPGAPTAVLAHGANPGLVSYFVKQALLDVARDTGAAVAPPSARQDWARLAQQLGVRCIHIAERDTQVARRRRQAGEFVNTWSVEGFIDEACHQPVELGWGSHERHFPGDGERHASGCRAAIYLRRSGASQRVRSWTPLAGAQHAFLVTHTESISIADSLTLGEPAHPQYRPTVHYAYHPCDDAVLSLHEAAARNWRTPPRQRVLKDDIISGTDELGVLLLGHARGGYWYGSRLSIKQARALCPHNSATSLQVTSSVLAGVVWAMKNPSRGIVEPDELPHDELLAICRPYLGDVIGVYTDWTPLQDRGGLFDEDIDRTDPWQFGNFRVV